MGHASIPYLKALQKQFPDNKQLQTAVFVDVISDCEICMISKTKKLPFKTMRVRATEPLQIIHSDVMDIIERHITRTT